MLRYTLDNQERKLSHLEAATAVELNNVSGGVYVGHWRLLGALLDAAANSVFGAGFKAETDENGMPIGPGGSLEDLANTPRM